MGQHELNRKAPNLLRVASQYWNRKIRELEEVGDTGTLPLPRLDR